MRRPDAAQHVRPQEGRIVVEVPSALRSEGPEACVAREVADILPILPQVQSRLRGTTAVQPIGENPGIHGAGTGAADAHDFEAGLLQQPIEDAPCESAMRAAALQCERDPPLVG